MRANNVVLNDKLEDVSISKAYSFPFEVSFSEIRKLSKGYVKLHWHDEIQISIVTKGSVEFIVGEKSYILKNGQAIFINTQRIHMAKSVGDEDCIYHSIMFNAKLLKMFPGSIIEDVYKRQVYTYTRSRIKWHLSQGHKVIFISGSPDFLVKKMAEKYNITDYRGSVYVFEDNAFTGKVIPLSLIHI